jgi:2-polyprenyl-3-methyl-5-hydroxy-6-metoxy-1,4-benzoquinol methylase/tetratricopeptide (TPR) repeat protein
MSLEPIPEPVELLFRPPVVDAAWLAQFERGAGGTRDWLAQCTMAVESRYAIDPKARDGHSRIGWALAQWGRTREARLHFEKDWTLDRMRRWQFLRYLETLLREGDEARAEVCVQDYYARHGDALDGWATLAVRHAEQMEFTKACELFRRDLDADRLSPRGRMEGAVFEAHVGHRDEAVRLVEDAYAREPAVRDGFGRLGDVLHASGDVIGALEDYRRDRLLGRLSPARLVRFAKRLAERLPMEPEKGDLFLEIVEVVGQAYREDGALRDLFARLAHTLWLSGCFDEAVDFLQRDGRVLRQSAPMHLRLAEYQLMLGLRNEAETTAREALRAAPDLARLWRERRAGIEARALPDLEAHAAEVLRGCHGPRGTWASYVRAVATRIVRDHRVLVGASLPDHHVVDIGCTPPLLLQLLRSSGYTRLTAVDPAIESFRAYLDRAGISGITAGVADLPVASLRGAADLICFCEVLEHLPLDILHVIEGLRAMLKPGGRLYVTTPNLRSISGLYSLLWKHSGLASKPTESVRDQFERARSEWNYFGHIREYTADEVVRLVESCGFHRVSSHFDAVVPVPGRVPRWVAAFERAIPRWRLFAGHLFEKRH